MEVVSGRWMNDRFFTTATFCWLKEKNECILAVANQMPTDGCYAFATRAVLYGDLVLNGSPPFCVPSVQELLECIPVFKPHKGMERVTNPRVTGYSTNTETTFKYIKKYGVSPEDVYPRKGWLEFPKKLTINLDSKITIDNYRWIIPTRYREIEERIRTQLVTARVDVTMELVDWTSKNGIYQGEGEKMGVHCMCVIGYGGATGPGGYYLCQNSWGDSWGDKKGYVMIARTVQSIYYPVNTRGPANVRRNE